MATLRNGAKVRWSKAAEADLVIAAESYHSTDLVLIAQEALAACTRRHDANGLDTYIVSKADVREGRRRFAYGAN